ncbi:hypothetical protein JCM8202_003226 [Rhodotorula sphaerocarpa]
MVGRSFLSATGKDRSPQVVASGNGQRSRMHASTSGHSAAAGQSPEPIAIGPSSVARPPSPHRSRPTGDRARLSSGNEFASHGRHESALAQAVKHSDLRALVQDQERGRGRPPSPFGARRDSSRSFVGISALGAAGELSRTETGRDGSGALSGGPRGRSPSLRRSSVAGVTEPVSPRLGSTSKLPPSSNRRLSSLATYTGLLGSQSATAGEGFRAQSPELRYTLDRRGSVPGVAPSATAARKPSGTIPQLARRLSGSSLRPSSPAPPGFKTSSRLGAAVPSLSPITTTSHAGSGGGGLFGSRGGGATSRATSPSPVPGGLVRAASPSPRSPPSRPAAPSHRSPSPARGSQADKTARAPSPGPLVIRGFDVPGGSSGLAAVRSPSAPLDTSLPANDTRPSGLRRADTGPAVRPPSALVDRGAEQRLEVRASRDFERIDEYYASRYAAARTGGYTSGMYGGSAVRDQRVKKREAEERLRRGYDRAA